MWRLCNWNRIRSPVGADQSTICYGKKSVRIASVSRVQHIHSKVPLHSSTGPAAGSLQILQARMHDDAVRTAWLRSGARLPISHKTCLPLFSDLFFWSLSRWLISTNAHRWQTFKRGEKNSWKKNKQDKYLYSVNRFFNKCFHFFLIPY